MMNSRANLERAIIAIYPDIEVRARASSNENSEKSLWRELSCCVLSSQVPYHVAVAAAEMIDGHELLGADFYDGLADDLSGILKTPLLVGGVARNYRFPTSRAQHLASTKRSIENDFGTLQNLLAENSDAMMLRSWLVANAPGLGPKQASMFLRNCGVTYKLAVLDRHVLDFMRVIGLYMGSASHISNLTPYRRYESDLTAYAHDLGAAVGLLDWAIWIVMRMSKSIRGETAA